MAVELPPYRAAMIPSRVLVVDDDPSAAEFCCDLLRSQGYEVEISGSAEEAMARIDAWHPHLVLLDVALPGEDGTAMARRLAERGNGAGVPIVLFTALTSDTIDESELRRTTGVRAVLYKPCRPKTMLQTIRDTLDLRPA